MFIKYGKINNLLLVFTRLSILKKMIKISAVIFSLLICINEFVACKNTSDTKLVYTENDTIKNSVKEKELGITWTQEVEAERLTKKISRSSMELGADVPYSKELFKISREKKMPVYPEFTDFGSLDTRALQASLKEKINNFCTGFSSENHSGSDSYFSRKYIFNYIFFINDFENGWKKNFGTDYPKEKSDIFNKWTIGEPFIGTEIIQIPVRFYSTCGIIDITIFLNSSGNNEFYQINIDRWKKV